MYHGLSMARGWRCELPFSSGQPVASCQDVPLHVLPPFEAPLLPGEGWGDGSASSDTSPPLTSVRHSVRPTKSTTAFPKKGRSIFGRSKYTFAGKCSEAFTEPLPHYVLTARQQVLVQTFASLFDAMSKAAIPHETILLWLRHRMDAKSSLSENSRFRTQV